MRLFCLLLFSCVFAPGFAQVSYFNSTDYWSRLVLDKTNGPVKLSPGDTAILVASNRRMVDTGLRFMAPLRDGKAVRYFVVYTRTGKWHVRKINDLYSGLQMLPDKHRDLVVYTEGMGKLFTSEVDRGINMSSQYKVNVLMLDYPSITVKRRTLGNYFFAMKNARISYKDFVPVLDTLKKISEAGGLPAPHLSLFFHSMGNILMRKIAKRGRLPLLNDKVWVDNLVLNAPCVPTERHNKWIGRIAFARHIYIHFNPEDHTLAGAHLLSKKHQLGERLHRPLATNAVYINFNRVAGQGHSNFLTLNGREPAKEPCYRHYGILFHGDTVNVHDPARYAPGAYKHIGWDLLER